MTISLNPFAIKIDNEGVTQVLVNNNGQFYFETYDPNNPNLSKYNKNKIGNNNNNNENENDENENENENNGLFEERFGSHTYHYDKGPSGIGLDFTFFGSKNVYGIPEHATSFSLKNTVNGGDTDYTEPFRLWNLDVFEYELDLPAALYGAIPFIMSHSVANSNGVFWLNSAETYIDVYDSANGKSIRWMSESGILESFIVLGGKNSNKNGSHRRVMKQYGELTGNQALPPLFSLAHHQCRWNYNSIDDVINVNDQFNTHNTPNDVIWLDIEHTDGKKYFTWDRYNFDSNKVKDGMIEKVYNEGARRMVTIVDPHIKKDSGYYIYNEITNRDLWTKTRDNQDYDGWCWPGDSRYPDFSNPEMRKFWKEQFKFDKYEQSTEHLFIWNDMNEPSVFNGPEITMPKSNVHYGGYTHGEVHNLYGYWVESATYEGLLLRGNNKQRPYLLSRSFFAGSQRYGSVWTGDNAAEWGHLEISVPMLLSMSIAGLPFVGADVGGFFNDPDAELMARWYELGAYYPFFRNHAHQDTKRREFYLFEEFYAQRMRHAIITRYRILPYIYTLFYFASNDLSPVMRPLWYEFSNDESTFDRDDAFMIGNALYVQGIYEAGVTSARVRLPTVKDSKFDTLWYDVRGSVTVYKGGNEYELNGFNVGIPVLRLGGTITPEKHRLRRSSDLMIYDPYTLIIALDAQGRAQGYLYLDDTQSLDYENKNAYYLLLLEFDNFELRNKIVHSSNAIAKDIVDIAIERIIIVADNDRFGLNNVESIQIQPNGKEGNSVISKEFGIGMNSLVIRKPNVKVNQEFVVRLRKET